MEFPSVRCGLIHRIRVESAEELVSPGLWRKLVYRTNQNGIRSTEGDLHQGAIANRFSEVVVGP